jgi:SulP family sulfate permease
MITREMADGAELGDRDVADAVRWLPSGVALFEINGPFFFGAAEQFKEVIGQVAGKPRALVVRMRHVPAMDSTGLHALRELARSGQGGGTRLVLAEVHAQPMIALVTSGVIDDVGPENVFESLDAALARAGELSGGTISPSRHTVP